MGGKRHVSFLDIQVVMSVNAHNPQAHMSAQPELTIEGRVSINCGRDQLISLKWIGQATMSLGAAVGPKTKNPKT